MFFFSVLLQREQLTECSVKIHFKNVRGSFLTYSRSQLDRLIGEILFSPNQLLVHKKVPTCVYIINAVTSHYY